MSVACLVKIRTSGRQAFFTFLVQAQLGHAHLLSLGTKDVPMEATHRKTAFMAASISGVNHLQAIGKDVSLSILAGAMYGIALRSCSTISMCAMGVHFCVMGV